MPRKTDRVHKQGEESKESILRATLEIAATSGYDGTTVAKVVERTGLPASSIYWHFGNKDQLLAATLEYSYRQWRPTAPTWVERAEPEDLRERVEQRFQRAAQSLVDTPQFWQLGLLLTLQKRVKQPEARARYLDVRRDTEDAMARWWTEVLLPEAFPDESARLAAAQRVARTHMVLMDGLFVHVRSSSPKDVRRLTSLLAMGWSAHLRELGWAR
ncbi:TetR/AcrR family transcriptional regulator [Janibacter terrae]|jgi:AcrR family transcriptional regulator|uniref:TetR/AcrR family transcriptional regulator n=1 Tax=Janibacter terrae TaxID=103817 RepID=A0ABZ2FIK2_9MICO|nr:TetR/AcrR family transcriptional regulator [Janibacter terrae]MBA4084798.1 TetR/AcrR family transcriptional regulator [Kytococcus sp.]